jgi:hypothetical protein
MPSRLRDAAVAAAASSGRRRGPFRLSSATGELTGIRTCLTGSPYPQSERSSSQSSSPSAGEASSQGPLRQAGLRRESEGAPATASARIAASRRQSARRRSTGSSPSSSAARSHGPELGDPDRGVRGGLVVPVLAGARSPSTTRPEQGDGEGDQGHRHDDDPQPPHNKIVGPSGGSQASGPSCPPTSDAADPCARRGLTTSPISSPLLGRRSLVRASPRNVARREFTLGHWRAWETPTGSKIWSWPPCCSH